MYPKLSQRYPSSSIRFNSAKLSILLSNLSIGSQCSAISLHRTDQRRKYAKSSTNFSGQSTVSLTIQKHERDTKFCQSISTNCFSKFSTTCDQQQPGSESTLSTMTSSMKSKRPKSSTELTAYPIHKTHNFLFIFMSNEKLDVK